MEHLDAASSDLEVDRAKANGIAEQGPLRLYQWGGRRRESRFGRIRGYTGREPYHLHEHDHSEGPPPLRTITLADAGVVTSEEGHEGSGAADRVRESPCGPVSTEKL